MNTETILNQGRQIIPRKSLTLVERIAVINEYEKNHNTRNLARIFGCGRTQIQNILRHRREYLQEWENNGDPYRKRRRQSITLLSLGATVAEWIQRNRARGITVTDDSIRQTGIQVAGVLNFPDFHPSRRWLERLKQKYKLCDLNISLQQSIMQGIDPTRMSLKIKDIINDLKSREQRTLIPVNKPSHLHMFPNNMPQPQHSNAEELSSFCSMIESNENCIYILSEDSSTGLSDNDGNEGYTWQSKTEDLQSDAKDLQIESNNHQQEEETQQSSTSALIKAITNYREALNHLVPLEQFALLEEDIRAVGLINQLENLFTEKLLNYKKE